MSHFNKFFKNLITYRNDTIFVTTVDNVVFYIMLMKIEDLGSHWRVGNG